MFSIVHKCDFCSLYYTFMLSTSGTINKIYIGGS